MEEEESPFGPFIDVFLQWLQHTTLDINVTDLKGDSNVQFRQFYHYTARRCEIVMFVDDLVKPIRYEMCLNYEPSVPVPEDLMDDVRSMISSARCHLKRSNYYTRYTIGFD